MLKYIIPQRGGCGKASAPISYVNTPSTRVLAQKAHHFPVIKTDNPAIAKLLRFEYSSFPLLFHFWLFQSALSQGTPYVTVKCLLSDPF